MNTKRRTGRLLGVLLCLVLVLGLFPITAQAEGSLATGLSIYNANDKGTINLNASKPYIQSNDSTSSSAGPGEGGSYVAYFDKTTGTLYLNGFQWNIQDYKIDVANGIYASSGHLTICLTGTNSLTVSTESNNNWQCYGIYAKALTITGTGSLTVNSTANGNASAYGIYTEDDLLVQDTATVNVCAAAVSGNNPRSANGFYAQKGDITLNGSSMSAAVKSSGTAYGVRAFNGGAVSIGGTLAVDLQSSGAAVCVERSSDTTKPAIALNGGALTVTGAAKHGLLDVSTARSDGTAGISITNSTLTMTEATGVDNAIESYYSNLTISGSTVSVGVNEGTPVSVCESMSINNSDVLLATDSDSLQAVLVQNSGLSSIDLSGSGTVTVKTKYTSHEYPIMGKVALTLGTKCTVGTYSEQQSNYKCKDIGGYRVVKFEHYETVPAAAVDAVTVSGGQGREITPTDVIVKLTDCIFADSIDGSEGWITNLPTGLSQSVTRISDTQAKITVSGTPTKKNSAAISVTVPQTAIKDGVSDVVAAVNENARFAIIGAYPLTLKNCTATVNGEPVTSGSKVEEGATVTVTATLTGNYKLNYWSITGYSSPPNDNTVTFTMPGKDTTAEAILYDASEIVWWPKVPMKNTRSANEFGDIKLEDIDGEPSKNENTELAVVWYDESGKKVSESDAIDRTKNYRGHVTVTCTGNYVFEKSATSKKFVVTLYTDINGVTDALNEDQYTVSADKKTLGFDVYLINLPQVTIPLYQGEALPAAGDCTVSGGCTIKSLTWSTTGTAGTSATISELKLERAKGTLWGKATMTLSVNETKQTSVTTDSSALTLTNATLSAPVKPTGVTVSGTVTSYGDASEAVTVTLTPASGTPLSTTISNGAYTFTEVPAGEYTLKVEKKGHVTREYAVTVVSAPVVQDIKIYMLGDINEDGSINIQDVIRLLNHVNNSNTISDTKHCDINKDGAVNIQDVIRLLNHVNNNKPLF